MIGRIITNINEKDSERLRLPSLHLSPMTPRHHRPLNLGIFHMRLPVSGWASIFHRVTGVLLVFALPVVLYLWQESLESAARFDELRRGFGTPLAQVGVTLLAWLFVQHLLSGIRHLLLDLDIGIDREAARASAVVVFAMGALLTLLLVLAWR